jgi:large subunit ribosomal protein L31
MKKDIHPKNYRPVVFQDLNDNTNFLAKSTVKTDETIKLDGVEYPLVKIHISSASHPFFTGQERLVDVEGRVDKFKARQDAAKAHAEKKKEASKKPKKAEKLEEKADDKKETVKTEKLGSHKSTAKK